jgi:DNA polymerase-1
MHANGFGFDTDRARRLLEKVTEQLKVLDDEILKAFPPRSKFLKEYTPKLTKHGTISKSSVPRGVTDLTAFTEGCSFSTFTWEEFNPASHKQIIKVLNEAGWQPEEKTQSHIDTERELNRLKYQKNRSEAVDLRIQLLHTKIIELQKTGWKVNETNLDTLPKTAPPAARLLAKRILLESRRRTLTEWLSLVSEDNRIRGRFYGIGAWTHRMAHQKPNTANIPNDVYVGTGKTRLLGKELRQLWRAPKNRLLAGVDAESIQFRIFAHLINDKELIEAITNGKKSDKTDPHSYNQRIFGPHCKTRNASKHSMFAIFFGGRANKISQIMACTKPQAEEAIERLLQRYPGLARLEKEVFPEDARRGYFIGLDGRRVKIPGDTVSQRKHLCMSGYLQNGEAVIMKSATIKWENKLKDYDSILVDLVHDEWQTETPNNQETAVQVAKMQADSLYEVGLDLELNCPLAGSYWNDDKKDYTIGTNWYQTH